MSHFTVVVKETRSWLSKYSFINLLLPYAMYIMFGALGIRFLDSLIWLLFTRSFAIINILDQISYFAFFFGLLLSIISPKDIKYAPYGLFAYAVYVLFPFTSFSLSDVIRIVLTVFLGYQLLRYTASTAE